MMQGGARRAGHGNDGVQDKGYIRTTHCDSRPEITAMSMLRGFNRKTHAPTSRQALIPPPKGRMPMIIRAASTLRMKCSVARFNAILWQRMP
jgi:hypothetical protein